MAAPGRVHRSRLTGLALLTSSWTTLVLGLKDIATRRGRAILTVVTVALAVMMAVAIVGLGTSDLDPTLSPSPATDLPADPADISDLPVWPSAVNGEVTGRIMGLISALQVLLGGVALLTLLAAASMTLRERLRELATLHALGCTTPQLVGASAVSQAVLGIAGTALGIPLGIPLGLGLYFVFNASSGFEGTTPAGALGLVALAAIAVTAVTAALPALLVQRRPTAESLATD